MTQLLTVVSYLFDLFIVFIFMKGILEKKKEQIPYPLFLGGFCCMELLLFLNETLCQNLSTNLFTLVTCIVSFTTTFLLCYFYDCSFKHKLFVSLSFQVFALLGEYAFSMLVGIASPNIFTLPFPLFKSIMNLGAKLMLLLLVLLCITFWKRKLRSLHMQYNLLLFVSPFITLAMLIFIPYKNMPDYDFIPFFAIFTCFFILNIVNYLLLEGVFQVTELKSKNEQMEQQIMFQKEKYLQLGAAYRNTRRIVHDTKKHYFSIQSFIKEKEYDKLSGYLVTAMEDLETTYARFNTGNLVIDSFLSNYMTVAESEKIDFHADVNVDANRIPIDDYELCVILGNLLDNCMQACRKISGPSFMNIQLYMDDFDKFIIHTTNSNPKTDEKKRDSSSNLYHGYGLDNIRKIVTQNHGIFEIFPSEAFEIYIVLPIIDVNKRKHLPV